MSLALGAYLVLMEAEEGAAAGAHVVEFAAALVIVHDHAPLQTGFCLHDVAAGLFVHYAGWLVMHHIVCF